MTYSAVNGDAIFKGDISLGTVERMEKSGTAMDTARRAGDLPASSRAYAPTTIQYGVAVVGQPYRRPGGVIP